MEKSKEKFKRIRHQTSFTTNPKGTSAGRIKRQQIETVKHGKGKQSKGRSLSDPELVSRLNDEGSKKRS